MKLPCMICNKTTPPNRSRAKTCGSEECKLKYRRLDARLRYQRDVGKLVGTKGNCIICKEEFILKSSRSKCCYKYKCRLEYKRQYSLKYQKKNAPCKRDKEANEISLRQARRVLNDNTGI